MPAIIKKHRLGLEYLILFVITALILGIKFSNLFWTTSLPSGWDTFGHYFAFLKGLELLKQGQLRGYILAWFGGMPLFYFYPPLYFWLMSLVALIFVKLSPVLIFKALIFLSLVLVPISFHFFVRSFLPKKKIHFLVSLALALAYLFYQPLAYGSIGVGLASTFPAGLLADTLAINFVLFFLGHFKLWLENTNTRILRNKHAYLSFLFGTLIIYTHTLSTIFAAFFALLILIFYFQKKNITKALLLLGSLILSGAYIIYPLVAYLKFSSGWHVGINSYFSDPLLPLLNFDPSNLLRANFLYFNWLWLFIFIFFLIGLIKLIKKQDWLLPMLFLVSFIIIPRDYLTAIFPTLPIHYYRIMPLIFFIYLSISAVGLQEINIYLNKRYQNRALNYSLAFILIALLTIQIYNFSFLNSPTNIKPRLNSNYLLPIQYHNNFSSYDQSAPAQKILQYFKNKQIKSRVATTIDRRLAMIHLGSAQYFDDFLPLNSTPSAFGLYAESAYQLPFIEPPLTVLDNDATIYGRVIPLMLDKNYMSQSIPQIIRDLGLFNIKYIITAGPQSKKIITKDDSPAIALKIQGNLKQFAVYYLNNHSRNYISSPQYLPALYIDQDRQLSFRDFALGWYKLNNILNFPVIFDGRKIKNINKNNLKQISFIIVHANKLSPQDIKSLLSLHKKILILTTTKYQGYPLPKQFQVIENFRPDVAYYKHSYLMKANYKALFQLDNIFVKNEYSAINKLAIKQRKLKAQQWQDEKISFTAQGPIIINASYFPDWHSLNPQQEVYQVTPGQMLVFSSGTTTLEFSASQAEKNSAWISLITFLIVITTGIFYREKKI